ncbi:hypothetical protein JOB18_010152 [Solea senegalensis]|uniref:Uncharacterized protein n=1 Tax=Solea senegalensis TaxID=28829 RepID=A0AAV6R923_SOLSE|nr:hypothetical protein JOB18_010152 [Solea senegalensis]
MSVRTERRGKDCSLDEDATRVKRNQSEQRSPLRWQRSTVLRIRSYHIIIFSDSAVSEENLNSFVCLSVCSLQKCFDTFKGRSRDEDDVCSTQASSHETHFSLHVSFTGSSSSPQEQHFIKLLPPGYSRHYKYWQILTVHSHTHTHTHTHTHSLCSGGFNRNTSGDGVFLCLWSKLMEAQVITDVLRISPFRIQHRHESPSLNQGLIHNLRNRRLN